MPTRFQKNLRDPLITDERFTTATITTFIWEFAENSVSSVSATKYLEFVSADIRQGF